jgi:hypothetical protein
MCVNGGEAKGALLQQRWQQVLRQGKMAEEVNCVVQLKALQHASDAHQTLVSECCHRLVVSSMFCFRKFVGVQDGRHHHHTRTLLQQRWQQVLRQGKVPGELTA